VNFLFVATEAAPYCRTGGLSDIVYGLAKELCMQGHDARIVVPHYRTIVHETAPTKVLDGLKVSLGGAFGCAISHPKRY
jgi:glycogen synthase